MNYNETINYIHSLGFFSKEPTLDRIKSVMQSLGNPQNNFKSVHIAGTNGKGSVCAMTSAALVSAGYKVGTFVSPYIIEFCERIQINGHYIPKNDLCRLTETVKATQINLTEFEFITAVGFLWFSENKIDVAVVETGLGGRLDATNILPKPIVSVITKIALDHTAVLGNTIEEIAAEKCGIIKDNTVVTTPSQPLEALDVLKRHTNQLKLPDVTALSDVNISVIGNSFTYKGEHYQTKLGGGYQIENALTAIETLENCGLVITDKNIKNGLRTAFIPARCEVVSQNPLVVIDGAHNPDGADALVSVLSEYRGCTAVIGVMKDKNYKSVIEKTLPFCKNVVCVAPNAPRALSAEILCGEAKMFCDNCFTESSVKQAIIKAQELSHGAPIFIFGSLYLASQIRPFLTNKILFRHLNTTKN